MNDYLFPKYFKMINNPDTFDKIVNEALVKHGYKVIKIGSGNFITNPQRFATEVAPGMQLFEYQTKRCPMCQLDMIPDQEVLRIMLEESIVSMGGNDQLEYFDGDKVLIVNNYLSLNICHTTMMSQRSLGVDLEGRLRVGGSINLI